MIAAGPRVVKVTIVGDGSVGKTTLLRRYSTGAFRESRIMTIGVDFQTVLVDVDGSPVKLTIWDIAGQERFAVMRDSFYLGAKAVAFAYDVSNPQSFTDLGGWREEVGRAIPFSRPLLVACKGDLEAQVPTEEARAYGETLPGPFFQTSSLTGEGVPAFFEGFARQALASLGDSTFRH